MNGDLYNNSFGLTFDILNTFSYTLFSSNNKLIQSIKIENKTDEPITNLILKISLQNDIITFKDIYISLINSKSVIEINDFELFFNLEKYKKIKDITPLNLTISLENRFNESLGYQYKIINILPIDYFDIDKFPIESLSTFIFPNNDYIKHIVFKGRKELSKLRKNNEYLGYLSNDVNDSLKEIKSIYNSILKLDIAYINSSSFLKDTRIKFPKEVYKSKQGSNVDIALFLIGALEYIGFKSILIFLKDHFLVGVFLNNESLPSSLSDNQNLIYTYSLSSISRLTLIEPSFIALKKEFEENNSFGLKELKETQNNFYALDIHHSRLMGYKPLIINKNDSDNELSNEMKEEISSMKDINLDDFEDESIHQNDKDKFYIWKKKLLDLSLQNKLINMKISTSNVQFLIKNVSYFSDFLYSNDQELELIDNGRFESLTSSKKEVIDCDNDILEELEKDNFTQKRIELFLDNKEFKTSIPLIYRKSVNDIEETGSNTLYAVIGILEYKINKVSKKNYYSPIILYPIEIIKKNNKKYYIRRRDQEPLINTTLIVYLKDEFGIDLSNINDLPMKKNQDSIDIIKIFNSFRKACINEGFKVIEASFLGRFSFNKFIMWDELNRRKDILANNPLVKSFLEGRKDSSLINKEENINLDKDVSIKDYCIPLSSDSSQIKAIIDSDKKKSYILIGPPGTGKSQTIANIIANSLYKGKKVLFCSEKKAALDVVYNRLKQLRIDPFCLELHSNKQDKREVLKSFDKVLQIGEIKRSEDFDTLTSSYDSLKEELGDLMDKIHLNKNYYISLYDSLVNYSKYKNVEGSIEIDKDLIDNFNENKYESIINLFSKGIDFSHSFNAFKKENPFKILYLDEYSIDIKNNLSILLKETIFKGEKFNYLSKRINKILNIDLLSNESIKSLYEIFDYLDNNKVYLNLLIKDNPKEGINRCIDLLEFENREKKNEDIIFSKFNKSIIEKNIDDYLFKYHQIQSFNFIKKFHELNKLLKEIRSYAFIPKSINKKNLENVLNQLSGFRNDYLKSKKNSLVIKFFLDFEYDYSYNEIDRIIINLKNTLFILEKVESISENSMEFRLLSEYLNSLQKEKINSKNIQEYKELYVSLSNNIHSLEDEYKFNFDLLDHRSYIDSLINSLKNILNHIDLINEWSNLERIFNELELFGIHNTRNLYLEEGIEFNQLILSFNKSLYLDIINKLIKDNHLESFIGINYNRLIDEFRNIDNKYKEEVIKEVVSRLSKNIPVSYSSNINSSEMGFLKKVIKNNGRSLSLRKIFSSINETILRLTPCILVSPLSCVKYLDPSLYHFDIVIFDEASQLSLSESISVIGRADSFVIAGDDKQLPPTTFFDKQVNDDEEDFMLSDLESLLDDAISLSFPINRLLFHYRSKDESLIAFSNYKFYENSLYTFPSPEELNSKVKFVKVNGIYDSGRSATNKEEAKEVVEYLIQRIKNNKNNNSFGIITFSVRQMDLIQELLDDEIDKDPSLYEKIKNLKEPIFIKNLENVQGDERDIILLSVCYGRNKNGKFFHNFGPINNSGGYRRLNVAITRSREEMIIFSSINYNDIDLSKTNSEGVRYLKSFLEYAENGKISLNNSSKESLLIKNGIEYYIAKDLKEKGYECRLHLGESKFKIDIGIINPVSKDSYILGIIIDSYSYSNQGTIKDKNIIEYNALISKGWNLIMIWALDYFDSPQKTIDLIVNKINESLSNSSSSKEDIYSPNFESINFEKSEKKIISHRKKYFKMTYKNLYTEGMLLEYRNRPKILQIIKDIIDVESPISKSFLIKRINEAFQVQRKNKYNSQVIEDLVGKIKSNISFSYGLMFYFRDRSHIEDLNFYRSSSERQIDQIAKEEIFVAMKDVIMNEISIDENALKKQVSLLLGYRVKTKKIDEILDEVIDFGINTKKEIIKKENNFIQMKGENDD